jgi:hypothetical protein
MPAWEPEVSGTMLVEVVDPGLDALAGGSAVHCGPDPADGTIASQKKSFAPGLT